MRVSDMTEGGKGRSGRKKKKNGGWVPPFLTGETDGQQLNLDVSLQKQWCGDCDLVGC